MFFPPMFLDTESKEPLDLEKEKTRLKYEELKADYVKYRGKSKN